MDFESVIRSRRSIRSYTSEALPEELIREILDEVRWSPSRVNAQPWSIYVVTGEALERLKARNLELLQAEAPETPDFTRQVEWPAHWAARMKQLFATQASVVGNRASRSPAQVMAAVFGAPCLLLLAVDDTLVADYACFDTGVIAQSISFAATAHGLGTCLLTMPITHPEVLREVLPEASDKRFVIGLALGYPDLEAPINNFERTRVSLDELVRWVS